MVYVRALDGPTLAERTLLLQKIAIQRENLINADFNRVISQFAEIKPLQSLYKPILDSMTGIFQQDKNFQLDGTRGIKFNDQGIISFVDDLSSKNIRSSFAISQALGEISQNAPNIGQAKSNYARELAQAYAKINIDEMTTEGIIRVIKGESERVQGEAPQAAAPAPPPEESDLFVTPPATPLTEEPRPARRSPPPTEERPRPVAPPDLRDAESPAKSIVKRYLEMRPPPDKRDEAADQFLEALKKAPMVAREFQSIISEIPARVLNTIPLYKLKGLERNGFELPKFPGKGKGKGKGEAAYRRGSGAGRRATTTAPTTTTVYTPKQAANRFKVLLGEHKAGNNSKILKAELKSLGDLLYKQGQLSKDSNMKIQKL